MNKSSCPSLAFARRREGAIARLLGLGLSLLLVLSVGACGPQPTPSRDADQTSEAEHSIYLPSVGSELSHAFAPTGI